MKPLPFVDFQTKVLKVKRTLQQRVLWRVGIDHANPCDLPAEEQAIARQLFGDVDTIPASARDVFALNKGARIAGTLSSAEVLVWAALTVPLVTLAAGEQAFAVIVAPDLKLAGQAFRYALGAVEGVPSIARLIDSKSADSFNLRRPDGKVVRIEALAAGRGGAGLRGRSLVACMLDEASFFRDADSGVVNDLELYRAVSPRIVPGGKLIVLSTAWMRSGLLHDLVDKNHGAPKTCVAAIAPTQLVRPNDPQLERKIAEERERDPKNAEREYDCVAFDGAGSSFIDPAAIDMCVDERLPPEASL